MAKAGRFQPDRRFNSKQLAEGIEIELEHTRSIKRAKSIAKDHLAEYKNYYKALEKMEERLKKQKKVTRKRRVIRKYKCMFPWSK